MTTYRSPWLDWFPKSRVPAYPQHRGSLPAGVVVVGGGLTGCLTAYALAAAGENVVLLEADRIGRGTTAAASGWISEEPGVPFSELERAIGRRLARQAWQAWRRAALDFSALLRRLDVKGRLEPHGAVTIATAPDQAVRLAKDRKARLDSGLESPAVNSRVILAELAVDARTGLRARDGATLDPYRACLGIAAAARDRGALLYERSPVRRVTFTRKVANVVTAAGSIRTRRVVIATGMPSRAFFGSLARHFWFHTRYLALTDRIPAKIRQQLGRRAVVLRDLAAPPHVVRWVDDERALVAGADTPQVPDRQRERTLVQRTGQLMYELTTLYPDISGIPAAYGWSAGYARTAEGLPYVGPHRNFPHHLFAFGNSGHDVTAAYLASRILLRHCLDEVDSGDDAFGFHR
jgi:glycine/D-amino acid oxidase-like deaminating enzyme